MGNNRMTNIQMITTPAVRTGYKITKLEAGVPVGATANIVMFVEKRVIRLLTTHSFNLEISC
jgi:hypothetical protein